MLLWVLHDTNRRLLEFEGLLDEAARSTGEICAQPAVDLCDTILNARNFDVTGCDGATQRAYGNCREAVEVFRDGSRDLIGECRAYLDHEPGR